MVTIHAKRFLDPVLSVPLAVPPTNWEDISRRHIGLMGSPDTDVLPDIRSTKHFLPNLSLVGNSRQVTDVLGLV